MGGSPRRTPATTAGWLVLTALLLTAPTACGGDEVAADAVLSPGDLTCDHDPASRDTENTVERLGGRTGDGYRVAFARSTRVGVVALVEGDVQRAYDDVADLPELGAVTRIRPDLDPGSTITGFAQVAALVEDACG